MVSGNGEARKVFLQNTSALSDQRTKYESVQRRLLKAEEDLQRNPGIDQERRVAILLAEEKKELELLLQARKRYEEGPKITARKREKNHD